MTNRVPIREYRLTLNYWETHLTLTIWTYNIIINFIYDNTLELQIQSEWNKYPKNYASKFNLDS